MHKSLNLINVTEPYPLKWYILCNFIIKNVEKSYMPYDSIYINICEKNNNIVTEMENRLVIAVGADGEADVSQKVPPPP